MLKIKGYSSRYSLPIGNFRSTYYRVGYTPKSAYLNMIVVLSKFYHGYTIEHCFIRGEIRELPHKRTRKEGI